VNLTDVLHLKQDAEEKIRDKFGRRSPKALILLTRLFEHPSVSIKETQEICSLSKKAARDMIDTFVEYGILKEITGNTRNRIFSFQPYVNLFK
jgi:Fic family protein